MEISQLSLARLSLIAFFLGMMLALFYGVMRATRTFWVPCLQSPFAAQLSQLRLPLLPQRKTPKKHRIISVIAFAEDFLFCIATALSLILLFYQGNNGKLRFSVLLCALLGFLACRLTLARPMTTGAELIVFLMDSAVRYAAFFVLVPFRFLIGRFQTMAFFIAKHVRRCLDKRSRIRYTHRLLLDVEQSACGLIFGVEKKNERKKHGTRKEKAV